MSRLGFFRRFSLRRCVGSDKLPCGCQVGLYETYSARTLCVLEVVDPSCRERGHEKDVIVDRSQLGEGST